MDPDNDNMDSKEKYYEIGATVISGLEYMAKEECEEKLKCKAEIDRGRIFFKVQGEQLCSIVKLQAVNNLFVLVNKDKERELDLYGEKDQMLVDLRAEMTNVDWTDSLEAWKQFTNSTRYLGPPRKQQQQQKDDDKDDADKDGADKEDVIDKDNLPIFRVTCTRSSKEGRKHPFSSMEAASATGGRINDMFGWPVKMKNYDIEVLLDINDNCLVLGIQLTTESLHKRNITHFGYTTLQSTIAYCMLRLSTPQDGDVICDPMCGSSAIAIEGANTDAWDGCHFLTGDHFEVAVEKSEGNITSLQEKRRKLSKGGLKVDVFQWDVTNLPLRSNSVDVFITDLPFGKRMGSRKHNWELYKEGLIEMARVCKPGTGRAVLLTQDKKCLGRVLQMTNHLWRKKHLQFIKMGGLVAGMYLLTRVSRATQAAEGTL